MQSGTVLLLCVYHKCFTSIEIATPVETEQLVAGWQADPGVKVNYRFLAVVFLRMLGARRAFARAINNRTVKQWAARRRGGPGAGLNDSFKARPWRQSEMAH